jgi:hypothetical protein
VIAGIDYSTRAVDVVLLDEDTDAATWFRSELHGADAFDRARDVNRAMVDDFGSEFWEDVLAIGIEDPRGYGSGSLYRVQGALLSCLPCDTLIHPLIPSAWRKTVGLPGNASKDAVYGFANFRRQQTDDPFDYWAQDACDAYCIALATRTLIQKVAA